jgi:arylsulfatase A-like enzyme
MAAPLNILFITVDQWRGDCLSALGHPIVRTPHLDALAAEGVLFRRHFANAVPCGPSRASLHTGMYLQNHRSGTNGTPLDARHTNWAKELRAHGYDPVLVGYTDTAQDARSSKTVPGCEPTKARCPESGRSVIWARPRRHGRIG